jgi:hypothetical protein
MGKRHPCLEWHFNPRSSFRAGEAGSCLDSATTVIGHEYKFECKNIYDIVKTHFMEKELCLL